MYLLAFLIGLFLGWIANLLADSLPFRQRPALPSCQACGAEHEPRAWLGISAFLLGVRSCAYCGRKRAIRWPLVEILFAGWVVFLWAFYQDPLELLGALFLSFVFLIILITDIELHIIPHSVTLPAIFVMIIIGGLMPDKGWIKTLAGGLGGFLIVVAFYFLGALFTAAMSRLRGEPLDEVAFGFGDVTLATLIGVAVGWPGIILAIFVGFLAGGLFSLGYIVITRFKGTYRPFSTIPYGPFLIIGGLLVAIGGRDLFTSILLS